ncbi:MAG: hypothetical protein HYX54_02145 [Chloroflexi bacterium]|nr:hypothetical protein [Chloroflexota bacterium]
MDPRDHLRALPDGLACTVCNEPVPVDRIRLLARRDDLVFIQVECERCGSTALEFLAEAAPEGVSAPDRPAISTDDVLAMHEFLDTWTGGVGALLAAPSGKSRADESRSS